MNIMKKICIWISEIFIVPVRLLIWIIFVGAVIYAYSSVNIISESFELIDVITAILLISACAIGWLCSGLVSFPHKKRTPIPIKYETANTEKMYQDVYYKIRTWGRAKYSWQTIHFSLMTFPIYFTGATLFIANNIGSEADLNNIQRIIVYSMFSLVCEFLSMPLKSKKRFKQSGIAYIESSNALRQFLSGSIDNETFFKIVNEQEKELNKI